MSTNDEVSSDGPYDVTPIIHSRYFALPVSVALMGTLIGAVRGSRRASLRFLAENAHRPPSTIRGWYLYNKTKNYRRIAAGLQEGGLNSVKLGVTALVWVGIEDGLEQCGQPWAEARELGAGVGTAGIFATVYRLPWRTGSRAMLLGGVVGGGMGFLRWARAYLEEAAKSRGQDECTPPEDTLIDPGLANGDSRSRPQ
ncbi:hypothetical protein PAXINDRAFT_126277 [Paxillus involutus ATCC 200175]|nr:hypothetical protein PAXINDRAFT_126277 [Paxillus involutus ATCC 200175]